MQSATALEARATQGWSYDPGDILQRHGRKLFWGAVLLFVVTCTDVPVTKVLTWMVIACVGLFIMLLVRQDSMLYHPVVDPRIPRRTPSHINPRTALKVDYEDVKLTTKDGVVIHAWLMFRDGVAERRDCHTLCFFHGNAGSIAHRLPNFKKLLFEVGVNVLAVEYRGFGHSTGTPSEAGLKLDAQAALEFLSQHEVIARDKVVLFGRSLGGAVAVAASAAASSSNPAQHCAVIIENSFTSVADMARAVLPMVRPLGRFLPWFIRNKWASEELMSSIKSPVLFLSGEQDKLVPPAQMQRLRELATSSPRVVWKSFPLGGHNDTFMKGGTAYYDTIRGFLRSVSPPGVAAAATKRVGAAAANPGATDSVTTATHDSDAPSEAPAAQSAPAQGGAKAKDSSEDGMGATVDPVPRRRVTKLGASGSSQ